MLDQEVSIDTAKFEVVPELDQDGHLNGKCIQDMCAVLDQHGFVIIPGLLSMAEADGGLRAVQTVLDDPDRERAAFASEIDIKYRRRDFCPLPVKGPLLNLVATLCQRVQGVIAEYCGTRCSVLELSTLTSYRGSSHQYLHRDPDGVIGILVALDDVTPEQGGTVFAAGTHKFCGGEYRFEGRAHKYMEAFRSVLNYRILRYNLVELKRMRNEGGAQVSGQEYHDRVYSRGISDNHQPNLYQFMFGKNEVFGRSNLSLRSLWRIFRYGKRAEAEFPIVQAAPVKGTVIIYRSDIFHAGPDNQSVDPRYILSLNLARDVAHPELWQIGYAPHSSLIDHPVSIDDLLNVSTAPVG
jgi:ectoine hydroxylase-related dioxygenase (phytanoyl-CoA dioxygenase family)